MGSFLRPLSGLLVLAALSTACGLKQGVEPEPSTVMLGAGRSAGAEATGAAQGDATGGSGDPLAPGPSASPVSSPAPRPGADEQQGTSVAAGARQREPAAAPPERAEPAPDQSVSQGVSDELLKIGMHIPLTGAAPLPMKSIVDGINLYWEWYGKVHGRRVEVVLRDDKYNPSHATSVCRELIEREKVFLLSGGGGADQIAACARVAAQLGIPYLSVGVDEGLMRKLPTYFAQSPSYIQQAPLLVEYIRKHAHPSNNRIAVIRDRTPSFSGVVDEFARVAREAGYEVLIRQTQNGPSDGQWLVANDIETAFPIMSPNSWITITRSPGGNVDHWVGVGLTMGLNVVATSGCPHIDGAMVFSPFPGFNQMPKIDPNFAEAGGTDDLQWALWGGNATMHALFRKMRVLNHAELARVMENEVIEGGILPTLRHRPGDHFGTNEVHLMFADCARGQWVTPDDGLFRTGF